VWRNAEQQALFFFHVLVSKNLDGLFEPRAPATGSRLALDTFLDTFWGRIEKNYVNLRMHF